jgi:hypothetical protein
MKTWTPEETIAVLGSVPNFSALHSPPQCQSVAAAHVLGELRRFIAGKIKLTDIKFAPILPVGDSMSAFAAFPSGRERTAKITLVA